MTRPFPPAAFRPTLPGIAAWIEEGLPGAIDRVAGAAGPAHAFLRRGWFAAALLAYGGTARTLLVEEDGVAAMAMPLVPLGPAALGMAALPGCYWPFRSFPVAAGAGEGVFDAGLRMLARTVRGVRIGPVYDGDPGAAPLIAAARARGWSAISRFVADSWLLDMATLGAEGQWPRGSTLRKNRFHEKHLASHGALDWRFVTGDGWTGAAFDALAAVEEASWIADRTGGEDAKFTARGHGAFWRAAAADPGIARLMRAAVLDVDGRAAAFSFNLDMPAGDGGKGDGGALRYAVANSYDPRFAKHSPGKLLQYRDMADARGRGVARVDWGAGDSGYKQVIGAEKGPAIRDWLLLRPGLPAFAGRLLARAWARSGGVEKA